MPASDEVERVIVHAPGGAKSFVPVTGGTVIGRAFPSDIVVDDSNVSKRHVRVALGPDGLVRFEDLGSTNGTWLNGLRVSSGTLSRGDSLRIGAVVMQLHAPPRILAIPGVLDYDAFAQRFGEEQRRHWSTAQPFSLLVVEGRQTVALSTWAPAVLRSIRAEDRAALLREDAMVVLLSGAGESETRSVASALAQGDGGLRVGWATYPEHGRDANALVSRALAGDPQRSDSGIAAVSAHGATDATDASARDGVVRGRATAGLWAMVERAAPSAVPVLVLGETGTGKELVARALHLRSPRADKPLRVVNCGAIPSNLVESTLFGAERGAFTGADRTLRGLFEQAHGGTLFLDEVGELPLAAQASLLRVLETGRITRIGGDRELTVDVRVVSATHRDLEQRCNEGQFRWDLYYRLNGLSLELPPLRARVDELPALVALFLRAASTDAGARGPLSVDARAMDALARHSWPGNIRELRHTIQRAALVARGPVVTLDDLPERVARAMDAPPSQPPREPSSTHPSSEPGAADGEGDGLREELRRHEVKLITEALAKANGSTSVAAGILQIPVRTLTHKMGVLGIRKRGE